MKPSRRLTASSALLAVAIGALATAGCYAGPVGVSYGYAYGGYGYDYPPPPPLRGEYVTISPGPGYLWRPGYWDWAGRSYLWVGGSWVIPPYRHAYWMAPRWERHGRRAVYTRGYWRH